MRLKEFIIFIIIFTIIYVLFFIIYDHFANKKSILNGEEEKKKLMDVNRLIKFAKFYQVSITINNDLLSSICNELTNNYDISLSSFSDKYNISSSELVIIILYLEYIGIIKKRCILTDKDCTTALKESDYNLDLKYSLYISNKLDYDTIISRAGLNSSNELEYLNKHFLMPGVILIDAKMYYVGDLND